MELIKLMRYVTSTNCSVLYLDPKDISWISEIEPDGDQIAHSCIVLKQGGNLKVLETPDQIAELIYKWVMPTATVPPAKVLPGKDLREHIRKQVVLDGRLEHLRSVGRNGAVQHYRRKSDNQILTLHTYVVRKRNPDGVCFFTVRSAAVRFPTDWLLLYAVPLKRMYLTRRSELISSNSDWVANPPRQLSIILREDTPLTDLLPNRLEEFMVSEPMPDTPVTANSVYQPTVR